jgi:dimethylamine/trimethylamine dehydrogenase
VRDYRVQQIQTMPNVDVFLDNELSADDALSVGAEHIVVATGAKWRTDGVGRYHALPPQSLGPREQLFTPDDIFAGRVPQGRVLLFDDDHYYLGSVLAEALVVQGAEVCLVTPENLVSAWGEMSDEQFQTQQHLLELGVDIITAHGLDAYDGRHAKLGCIYTGRSREMAADAVLLVTARNPLDGLYREITATIAAQASGSHPSIEKIGDCDAPAIIAAAVYAGHRYARELGVEIEQRDVVRQDKLFETE